MVESTENTDATPWVKGNLSITAAALKAAEREALRCYPSEGCGFLSGPADLRSKVDTFVAEVNEADRYHELDPVRFPRTSATYFKINELRAQRAFEHGELSGQPIKVIFHSHCDAGAHFSQEDAATFAHDGSLMWPCSFLVISVQRGRIEERKLWIHVPGTNSFEESEISVVDE